MSNENTSEKKLRFRSQAKVQFTNDNKVEDLFKNDRIDEIDSPREENTPSLFTFLGVELTRGYTLENDEERYSSRREKVYTFMRIPQEVEKFMAYGLMQCSDSFLFVCTFLPLRVILALWGLFMRPCRRCFGRSDGVIKKDLLSSAEICDILKALILVICSILLLYVDTNIIYHLIKSQSVIKLYIFYNMLEVGDRLFSAFGQDTIDALFWTATEPRDRRRQHLGVIPHLIFALTYVFLHSLLVLCQATTLNVAMNSNNKGLLTIMMSNNFVELKGSVFKKFDKSNLFQVSCSDVRERFHLVTLLCIVVLQTMKEYSWKSDRFWILLPDCFFVFTAELCVDWIKHAFITRFNELPVEVYKDYKTSLAYDMAQTRQKTAFSDHSDLVARRMGFIPLPLGVVMIRVLVHSVHVSDIASLIITIVAFMNLCSLRVINSLFLLSKACNYIKQHKLEKEKGSTQSPSSNRANSPLPQTKNLPKDWLKDTGTSPIKPIVETTIFQPVNNVKNFKEVISSENDVSKLNLELGSSAIFANSTVDLKNATLNEELLKVEGDDIKLEDCADNFSKSEPSINCDFGEVEIKILEAEPTLKKRAESEPNLANCNNEEEE